MKKRAWTTDEEDRLRELCLANVDIEEIADRLGRTEDATRRRIAHLQIVDRPRPHFDARFWTDEKVAQLKALWNDGLSCSEIAKRIGAASRNAVIGKRLRLGLPERTPSKPQAGAKLVRSATSKAPPKFRTSATRVYVMQPPKALPSRAPEGPGLATIHTLTPKSCRWPIGDPGADDFTFCGQPRVEGLSYCNACAERAYVRKPNLDARADERRRRQELYRAARRYA